MTSSPGPTPRARSARCRAVVPLHGGREIDPHIPSEGAAFVSHDRGFFRNNSLDDRNPIGRARSLDMERTNLPVGFVN
jgi:hypothetical protein